MPTQLTETLLSSTYRDDFKDSNNFHRILFNSGRALQARELTQMQTIIQKEVERFGKNIFKEGAAVNPGGLLVNKRYEFIKLDTGVNPLPSDAATLAAIKGSEFTGATSGIKFVVLEIVDAVGSDPATLYVRYTDTSTGGSVSGPEAIRITPGENISSASVTLTVQTTNTTTNPAAGQGTRASVHGGDFFAQGHFVNVQPQSILLSKYTKNPTKTVGFRVIQDVITSQDDAQLFDNQGAVPNVTAPGADRLRIRLELTTADAVDSADNFIFYSEVVDGTVMQTVTGFDQYNKINDVLAVRGFETNGNFNVKTFKIKFDDVDSDETKLDLGVSPGTAYVNGYRADVKIPQVIRINKAQDTLTLNNQLAPVVYGNYVDVIGNFRTQTGSATAPMRLSQRGMFDVSKNYRVELRSMDCFDSDIYGKTGGSAYSLSTYSVYNRNITSGSFGGGVDNRTSSGLTGSNNIQLSGNDVQVTLDSIGSPTDASRQISNGDMVHFSGLSTSTELNSLRLFVGDLNTGTKTFTCYSDPSLTTKFDGSANGPVGAVTAASSTNGGSAKVDWGTIGFAHVRYVDKISDIRHRIYLNDVQMLPGKSFRNVRSFGSSRDLVATIIPDPITNQTAIAGTNNNTLLMPFARSRLKTLTDISLDVQRKFSISLGSGLQGQAALTAAGEAFVDLSEVIGANVGGGGGAGADDPTEGTFTFPNSTTLEYTGNGTYDNQNDVIDVLAKVRRATGSIRTKTLTNTVLEMNLDSYNGAPLSPKQASLRKADLYKVNFIVDKNDSSDITNKFIIDNGQRDNFYENARLILKGGFAEPVGKIKINFSYFEHGPSGDFFAPQSYTDINYSDIPSHTLANGTEVSLRDVIDMRPRKANHKNNKGYGHVLFGGGLGETANTGYIDSTNTGKIFELPTPTDVIQADTEVYLPRHDRLILNEAGEVNYIQGVSNTNPKYPEMPAGGLELYQIQLRPFTVNDSDLSTNLVETRGYTMKDIGSIEDRVDRLEEMTSLSLLEIDLKNFSVLDSTGADRTKAGFFVDNFVDHLSSDPTNLEFRSSIEPREKFMRASFAQEAINLVYDSDQSTNTILKGDNVYLKYTQSRLLNQPVYSQTENINPFQVIVHKGRLRISPGSDDWKEVNRLPDRVIDGGFRINPAHQNLFNQWSWGWGGVPLSQLEGREAAGSWSAPRTNSWQSGNNTITERSRSRTVARVVQGETLREFIEDKVLDVAIIPWARSRFISFRAQGMRPNTQVFPYFDGKRVDDWVRDSDFISVSDARGSSTSPRPSNIPGNRYANATQHPKNSTTLIADAKGEVTGSFFLPNTDKVKFKTGEREFKLLDITVDNEKDAASIAKVIYTSNGILETRQRNFRSTRTLDIQVRGQRQVLSVNVSDNDDDGGSDPLAQSFRIVVPNGIFCTKIGIRFATKDDVIPVQCQLRPLVNGHPAAEDILPGAIKFLEPSLVNTSDDGTALTYFEFDEPIYLNSGTEYALVLLAESIDYNVYVAQTGEFVFGSTEKKITKQPSMGSMFKSQNGSTWEPAQNFDMAFELWQANFVTDGECILENNHPAAQLLPMDPFSMDASNQICTVYQPDHGFKRTDRVTISGATGTIQGVSSTALNATHTITNAENDYYQFDHGVSSGVTTGAGGGSSIIADKNYMFQTVWPNIQTLVPPTCEIDAKGKFTTAQSIAEDTPSADYQKDTVYQQLALSQNNDLGGPRLIPSETNNNQNLGVGLKAATLSIPMSTRSSVVSPVIDLQRASLWCFHNRIDFKEDASGGSHMNPNINQVYFTAETDPNGGTALAKHITRPVTLEVDAVGLKVYIAVNRPTGCAVDLYHKTTNDEGDLNTINWTLCSPERTLAPDDDPFIFREYEYTIGGQGGTLEPFTKFQLKIVMNSQFQHKVPIIRDLRAIAMGD